MPPLEAWEKVLIDGEGLAEDLHGFIECTACHGGQAVDDMELAHEGIIPDPAASPAEACTLCHVDIGLAAANSLHSTLQGYDTVLYERSAPEHHETLEYMESYHCDSCHATCGDCHVSQPDSAGGGLLEGHTIVKKPPMSRSCTACHGSRVKNEYYGLNEGVKGDVHFRQARLACTDCHTAEEMHGMGEYADLNHRHDGPVAPSCTTCHGTMDAIAPEDGGVIVQHQVHDPDLMSCQACHSVSYTNCTNCHVDRTEEDVPFYTVEAHELGFFLGKNPLQSDERPWEYVPLRHVPIDEESFSVYGDNLLPNFLARPTWTFATPHNIQRETPQNASCASCHNNPVIFLTEDDVAEAELGGANLDVIVEQLPFPLPEDFGSSELPESETDSASDSDE